MNELNRRAFLAASATTAGMTLLPGAGSAVGATPISAAPRRPGRGTPPMAISSGNGLRAVARAVELMRDGADPLDAVVAGINIVEDDPDDMTVGYGGLPNEDGVVQLDASVMHGPSHKAGAVAALEGIRHPSRVALDVLRRTNHALLVDEGALRFARAHGYKEENLLTDKAREAWLRWKANLTPRDDWLDDDEQAVDDANPLRDREDILFTTGTIHCSGLNAAGDLGACTSTSGLSYKIPGRVGDSPIIGAGNFVDNLVGAAGATGRGESAIKSCGAFQVVQHMERGDDPTEACLRTLRWVANHTRRRRLLNDRGEPNFNLIFYALRKDGAFGGACMRRDGRPRTFTVHDGAEAKSVECAYLFE